MQLLLRLQMRIHRRDPVQLAAIAHIRMVIQSRRDKRRTGSRQADDEYRRETGIVIGPWQGRCNDLRTDEMLPLLRVPGRNLSRGRVGLTQHAHRLRIIAEIVQRLAECKARTDTRHRAKRVICQRGAEAADVGIVFLLVALA